MEGGRRMEGNSIWTVISIARLFCEKAGGAENSRWEDVRGVYLQ